MADPAPQNSAAFDVAEEVAVGEADPDVGPVGVPFDVDGEGVPLGPEHDATADIARKSTSADPNAVSRLLGWNISVSFHNRLMKGRTGTAGESFHAAPPTVQHFSIVLRQAHKKNRRRTNLMGRAGFPWVTPGGRRRLG